MQYGQRLKRNRVMIRLLYSNFQKYNQALFFEPFSNIFESDIDKKETIFMVNVKSTDDQRIFMNYEDYLNKNPKEELNPNEVIQ